jgi:hypothetical protein
VGSRPQSLHRGGVSSSLDAALKFVSILTGSEHIARGAQLLIQYHPSPRYDCGDPTVAGYDTYRAVASPPKKTNA